MQTYSGWKSVAHHVKVHSFCDKFTINLSSIIMKIPMQKFVSGYPNDQENSNIEHFTSQKCKVVRSETTFEFAKKSSGFF